jgi:hypothetical protein
MSTGFSTAEKNNFLFKSSQRKPSTLDERRFYTEPNRPAGPIVLPDQIWQSLPDEAPIDLVALTDSSLDDNGNVMKGSLAGKTSGSVRRYIKIPLTMLIGTDGKAYEAPNSSVSHPSGYADGVTPGDTGTAGTYNRITQDVIPFNHDPVGSYLFNLYRSNEIEISFGTGEWLVDNRSGIVTFYEYDDISTDVDENNPPLFSFYRYVGDKGLSSGSIGTTSVYDELQLGTTCITNLGVTAYFGCINMGDDCDGAIRICTTGGDGDPTKTAFHIQKKKEGEWCTIFKTT